MSYFKFFKILILFWCGFNILCSNKNCIKDIPFSSQFNPWFIRINSSHHLSSVSKQLFLVPYIFKSHYAYFRKVRLKVEWKTTLKISIRIETQKTEILIPCFWFWQYADLKWAILYFKSLSNKWLLLVRLTLESFKHDTFKNSW